MDDVLYEISSMHFLARLPLDNTMLGCITIMNVRQQQLRMLSKTINQWGLGSRYPADPGNAGRGHFTETCAAIKNNQLRNCRLGDASDLEKGSMALWHAGLYRG